MLRPRDSNVVKSSQGMKMIFGRNKARRNDEKEVKSCPVQLRFGRNVRSQKAEEIELVMMTSRNQYLLEMMIKQQNDILCRNSMKHEHEEEIGSYMGSESQRDSVMRGSLKRENDVIPRRFKKKRFKPANELGLEL